MKLFQDAIIYSYKSLEPEIFMMVQKVELEGNKRKPIEIF